MKKFFLFVFFTALIGCISEKNLPYIDKKDLPGAYQFKKVDRIKFNPNWWQSFNNCELNRLIQLSKIYNLNLQVAINTIKQIELEYKEERTNILPEIELNTQYIKTKKKYKNQKSVTTDQYSLGLTTNYEIDVWGKIREGIKISSLNKKEAIYSYDSLFISIASEVTYNWLNIVYLHELKRLLLAKLELLTKKLKVSKQKYKSGEYTFSEILKIKEDIINTKKQLENINTQKEIYINHLRLLTGFNNEFAVKASKLPDVSLPLDIGIPADLLRNRPDIKIAEINLLEDFRKYKIARINRFPSIIIDISHVYSAEKIKDLLDSWVTSLIGSVVFPILDYNKRRYVEYSAKIQMENSFLNFKNALYTAILEVENNLIKLQEIKNNINTLNNELKFEKIRLNNLILKYKSGSTYLSDILDLMIYIKELEKKLSEYKLAYNKSLVDLYKSIGGSYFVLKED